MSFYLKDLLPGRSLSWLSAPVPDGSYFLVCLLGRKPQCGRAFTALRQPQGDSSFGFWLPPRPQQTWHAMLPLPTRASGLSMKLSLRQRAKVSVWRADPVT